MYTDSGFYSDFSDIDNYKEKVVKGRKDHTCSACRKVIKSGEHSVRETGFMDGEPVSSYLCLPCIEDWLVETEQVEFDGEVVTIDGLD